MKKQNETKAKRVFNLIIVDESGSMSVIRKQAFSGMNETNTPHSSLYRLEKPLWKGIEVSEGYLQLLTHPPLIPHWCELQHIVPC